MRALIAAVFLASPLAAQDLPYSDALTETCLASASTPQARSLCIGKSAAACMATPAGGSTVGMGGCLDREVQFWDRMLNANYHAQMAQAKSADTDNLTYNQNAVSQADALRAMQRSWIAFRDASCDYERSKWGGGTGGGPATLACLLNLTGQQALVLDAPQR